MGVPSLSLPQVRVARGVLNHANAFYVGEGAGSLLRPIQARYSRQESALHQRAQSMSQRCIEPGRRPAQRPPKFRRTHQEDSLGRQPTKSAQREVWGTIPITSGPITSDEAHRRIHASSGGATPPSREGEAPLQIDTQIEQIVDVCFMDQLFVVPYLHFYVQNILFSCMQI